MTSEAAAFLWKAYGLLADARTMSTVKLHDAAGRTAYLAAFHAARGWLS